jgi:hypothetical protein
MGVLQAVNGEVVSLRYKWRPVGLVLHAFSRTRNQPGAELLVALCNERATPLTVRESEAEARFRTHALGTCFACRMLMDDQLS